MKKLVMAGFFCLIVSVIFAQKSPEDKANAATDKMAEELGLTEQQKTDVKASYLKMYQANAELRSSKSADKSTDRAAIRADFEQQIDAILTPHQKEQWNISKKEKSERTKRSFQRKMQGAAANSEERATQSANRTADRLTEQVGLSAEQRQLVFEASKQKALATQALRPLMRTDQDEAIDKRKKINAEYKATINTILTAEQKAKRESIRKSRMSPKHKPSADNKSRDEKMEATLEAQQVEGVQKEMTILDRKAAAYTKKMSEKLGMSEKQDGLFHMAYLNRLKEIDALNKDKVITNKKEMKAAVINAYQDRLQEILTPEQLKKMESLKKSKNRH